MNLVAASVALLFAGWLNQQPAPASLNYDYFKAKVQPIFVAKRTGHARCIACHGSGTPLRLQPPSARGAWTEEDSKKNFAAVERVALPGNLKSLILIHPLEETAGGDFFHSGGKHWTSQSDPEWQALRAFVMGQTK